MPIKTSKTASPKDLPYSSISPEIAQRFRDRALAIPFYARVIALQPSHPIVGAGLQEHSVVFDDPFGRAVRTTQALISQIYQDPEELGKQIRAWHKDVKGTDTSGKAYHALDPVPWAWVHYSAFDAILYALKTMGRLPDRDTQEIMYREWKIGGKFLGVKPQLTPDSFADFEDYIQTTIQDDLTATDNLRSLWDYLDHVPLSALPGVPKLAGKLAQQPLAHAGKVLIGHALPKNLRGELGIKWGMPESLQHEALMMTLKTTNAALPESVRVWPESLGKSGTGFTLAPRAQAA